MTKPSSIRMWYPLRACIAVLALGHVLAVPHPAYAVISNGENAIDILGEYNSSSMADNPDIYTKNCLNDGASPYGFSNPEAGVIDSTNHWLFVADGDNNRVLVFPLTTGNLLSSKTPSYVLGQANFTTCAPNQGGSASQSSLSNNNQGEGADNAGLAVDPTNHLLYVDDVENNRVMVFSTSSMSNGENASYVLGQTNYTNTGCNNGGIGASTLCEPAGVALDTTHHFLFVADYDNNRVLVFPTASGGGPASGSGENATYVIGQTSFTGNGENTTQSTLNNPDDVAVDATNQLLYVADMDNNRVLIFSSTTTAMANGGSDAGESATYELGQTAGGTQFTSNGGAETQLGMATPSAVTLDTTNSRLFVTDFANDRVLIFSTPISSDDASPAYVIGATDFVGDNFGDASYNGFQQPGKPAYDSTNNLLYLPDGTDSRVLEFNASSTITTPSSPTQSSLDACAVANGGLLYCWGYNGLGEAGVGNTNEFLVPAAVASGATSWSTVSMGKQDACGIASGALYCWGGNGNGEDGLGNTTQYTTPQQVGSATTWSTVSQSSQDACGILSNALYCWGLNGNGEDGVGTTTENNSPQLVTIATATPALLQHTSSTSSTSATYTSTTTAGSLLIVCEGWGSTTTITTFSASDTAGNTWTTAVGPTYYTGVPGTLGCLYALNKAATASDVVTVTGTGASTPDSTWIAEFSGISASSPIDVTAATTGDSTTPSSAATTTTNADDLIFGVSFTNTDTQGTGFTLLDSPDDNSDEYKTVTSTGSYSATFACSSCGGINENWIAQMIAFKASTGNWSTVSTGGSDTCAITTGGALYCWGYNGLGEDGLGNGTQYTTPQQVGNYNLVFLAAVPGTTDGDIGSVSAANTVCQNAAVAAGVGGTYYAWISDGTNSPSSGTYAFTHSTVPYQDINGNTIATSWTTLTSGTLSHGIEYTASNATESGVKVWTNVSTSGGSTTPGSSTTGNCAAWTNKTSSDKGNYGLSNSTTSTWTADTNVACNSGSTYVYCFQQDGGNSWSSVSQGGLDTCAITTTGKLYCWGENKYGELGQGNTIQYDNPVQVGTATNWIAASISNEAGGSGDACGIQGSSGSGSLWCWGKNNYGEDGLGTTTQEKVPVQVTAVSGNWSAVSMGTYNYADACGVNTSTLYCWGQNGYGEDGNNTQTENNAPVAVTLSPLNGEDAKDLLGEYNSMTSTSTVLWTSTGANNGPNALGFYITQYDGEAPNIAMDGVNHYMYVTDSSNNRVLVYALNADNSISSASGGHTASYVIGQSSLQGGNGVGAFANGGFNYPSGPAVDSANQRLFVVDGNNNAVQVFSTASLSTGMSASNYLGGSAGTTQSDLDAPSYAAYDAVNSRLFVSDVNNNRVLVYNVLPSYITSQGNGYNASYVLGQTSWTDGNANQTGSATPTQSSLDSPLGLAFDPVNERLFVADNGNYRVMVFNVAPATLTANGNGENASYELGQASGGTAFTTATAHCPTVGTTQSGFCSPYGVSYDPNSSRLFVADPSNSRVTVFNVGPNVISNGMSASYELGQASGSTQFTTGQNEGTQPIYEDVTQSGVYGAAAVYYDPGSGRLFVGDGNNRVMIFDATTISTPEQSGFIPGYE